MCVPAGCRHARGCAAVAENPCRRLNQSASVKLSRDGAIPYMHARGCAAAAENPSRAAPVITSGRVPRATYFKFLGWILGTKPKKLKRRVRPRNCFSPPQLCIAVQSENPGASSFPRFSRNGMPSPLHKITTQCPPTHRTGTLVPESRDASERTKKRESDRREPRATRREPV